MTWRSQGTTALDVALDYARRGIPAFPVIEKRPALSREFSGGRNWGMSDDEQTLRKNFAQLENATIGIPTGKESGFFVVDIDTIAGGHAHDGISSLEALEAKHGPLPPTVEVVSPSGSRHLYFKHIDGIGNSASAVGDGIDVRGCGGYVVAGGSMRSDGPYRFARHFDECDVADAPRWLVFAAMFSKSGDPERLAQLGIDGPHSFDGIEPHDWSANVVAKEAIRLQQVREEREAEAKEFKAQYGDVDLTGDYAKDADRILQQICDIMASAPAGQAQDTFIRQATRAGHLLAHPEYGAGLTRGYVEQELIEAARASGRHGHETNTTIKNGIDHGLESLGTGADWLEHRKHNILERARLLERGAGLKPWRPKKSKTRKRKTIDEATADIKASIEGDYSQFPGDNAEYRNAVRLAQMEADGADPCNALDRLAKRAKVDHLTKEGKPAARAKAFEGGLGKTKIAGVQEALKAARNGQAVVVAEPEHVKAGELYQDIKQAIDAQELSNEISVGHWKGQSFDGMCERPDDLKVVTKSGVSGDELCGSYFRTPEGQIYYEINCPKAESCLWQKQRRDRPNIWVVPHAALMSMRKAKLTGDPLKPKADDHFREVDILIVDENILGAAIGETLKWSTESLVENIPSRMDAWGNEGWQPTGEVPAFVSDLWRNLVYAANASVVRDGRHNRNGLATKALSDHDVTLWELHKAIGWHERQAQRHNIDSKMTGNRLKEVASEDQQFAEHRRRAILLTEVFYFLLRRSDQPSGRICVIADGNRRTLHFEQFTPIHESWMRQASMMLLDATMQPVPLLEKVVGRKVDLAEKLSVEWREEIKVIQITGAPTRASQLGLRESASKGPNANFIEMQNFAFFIAEMAKSGDYADNTVLFVPRKEMGDRILAAGNVPDNLDIVSPGRVVGRNEWENAAGVVATASSDAGPVSFERQVGAVFGSMPKQIPAPPPNDKSKVEHQPWWWTDEREAQTESGDWFTALDHKHPDPIVEELWKASVAGQLEQIAVRLRPLWREGQPGFIVVCSDHELPIPVSKVLRWEDVNPGKALQALQRGPLPENAADMARLYPDLWPNEDAARYWNKTHKDSQVNGGIGWLMSGLVKEGVQEEQLITGAEQKPSKTLREDSLTRWNLAQHPSLKHVHYQKEGSTNHDGVWYLSNHACAYDPMAWLSKGLECDVRKVVNTNHEMERRGIIYTAAPHAFVVLPDGWPSLNACREAMRVNPPEAPQFFTAYQLRLDGPRQREYTIYADSDAFVDEATLRTQIEADQGMHIKTLERQPPNVLLPLKHVD